MTPAQIYVVIKKCERSSAPEEGYRMGLLLIGVVGGILLGFGWTAASQGYFEECTSSGCFDKLTMSRPVEPRPMASAPDAAIARTDSATKTSSGKGSSAKKSGRNEVAKNAPLRTRNGGTASDRSDEASDNILNKAKASIAAKMEDPGSAEFDDMKRAIRKNTLGRPVDTICGHVRGKNAAGQDIGEKPFLYLVKEDDAYVVDGKPDSAAAIAYRNICN
jgi:hypothetical protein